jgi:hypothetical protein
MKRWLVIGPAAAMLAALALQISNSPRVLGDQPAVMKIAAPEFEELDPWINSKPLTMKALRGQVVVVHFWAFG